MKGTWPAVIGSARALRSGTAAGYLVALVAMPAAALILVPLRHRLGLLNVGFLLLMLVVLIAARWGWGPAFFASILANLALNFFFVPPVHAFTVQAPNNLLALLVFLGVAALASWLLARARAGEAAAVRRERETAILYDLSRLLIGEFDLPHMLETICDQVRETFGADSCAIFHPEQAGAGPVAWSGTRDTHWQSLDERRTAMQAMTSGTSAALGPRPGQRWPRVVGITGRSAPVVYVPLRVGGQAAGVMRVAGNLRARVFTADEERLLEAFADEAAPAMERDRLLREAARAQALQEADQLKSALMSAVSHDLRTPLTTILASASSLLQTDVEWDEETRRQFLTQIEQQALRLNRLVGNLLDLSRIEGGALRPEMDWYDVREFLDSVIESLEPVIGRARIRIAIAPDAEELRFDHVEMTQVMANLIENAAKFAPAGSAIRIDVRRLGEEAEFSVSDQGPGIAPDERERVFEKFYRIVQTSGRARGTGLGLAICKGFVEAQGGRIRVEDAPGGGARFVVALPAPPSPPSPLLAREVGAT